MKSRLFVVVLSAVVGAFFVSCAAEAERRKVEAQGCCVGKPAANQYMDGEAVTMTGEVVGVEKEHCCNSGDGIHVVLKTEDGKFSVHLGPAWYIDTQEDKLGRGDVIEVHGSMIGRNAVIAKQVRRGDDVLTLRDDEGYPVWTGWKHRVSS